MIHLQQRNTNRKKGFGIVLVIVVVFLFLLFQSQSGALFLSSLLASLSGPLWEGEEYVLGEGNRDGLAFGDRGLATQNQKLEQELTTLRMRSLSRELLLQENKELKELLGRSDTSSKSVLGVVLVGPTQTPYDTLIIDLGKEDALEVGMEVVVGEDVAIGRIEKVYTSTSRVRLFSSSGENLVVLLGEDHIRATAKGQGGGNFLIELPHGLMIFVGDIITLPSLTARLVGVVEEVITQPSGSFQIVRFKSPVNMHQLKWVQVLLK